MMLNESTVGVVENGRDRYICHLYLADVELVVGKVYLLAESHESANMQLPHDVLQSDEEFTDRTEGVG